MMTPLKIPTLDPLLAEAETFFRQRVAPLAAEIDTDTDVLTLALQGMGDHKLLALQLPRQWGGNGIENLNFQLFQMKIARYSGALAFLQTQHQSAGNWIAKSENADLKQQYLPKMASGRYLIGVGFSHLRRQGQPLLTATPSRGGYLLSGTVPWITGWGIFQEFIVGATLPSGEAIYGLIPFESRQQADGGTSTLSAPLTLAAMNSTQTVTGTLHRWFLDRDRILTIQPSHAMGDSDRLNVLYHSFFALGCAQAGLDILQRIASEKSKIAIADAYSTLQQSLDNCLQAHIAAFTPENVTYEQRLRLRAEGIALAGRCAHAAVTTASGAANVLSHPAQRVYREALLFTVSGQTSDIMAATLARLTNS